MAFVKPNTHFVTIVHLYIIIFLYIFKPCVTRTFPDKSLTVNFHTDPGKFTP